MWNNHMLFGYLSIVNSIRANCTDFRTLFLTIRNIYYRIPTWETLNVVVKILK